MSDPVLFFIAFCFFSEFLLTSIDEAQIVDLNSMEMLMVLYLFIAFANLLFFPSDNVTPRL